MEQTIEVTVDNDISIPEEINIAIEEKEVKEIIDCGKQVLFVFHYRCVCP